MLHIYLQPVSVGTLPLPMQELAIVEDLLFLMMVRFVPYANFD